VSPLDDKVRRGILPPTMRKPLPLVPGASAVGHVADPGASGHAPGTRVLLCGCGCATKLDGAWREIVLDSLGGDVTGQALSTRRERGVLVSIGYTAGTKAATDITDLSWKTARLQGFLFTRFTQQELSDTYSTYLGSCRPPPAGVTEALRAHTSLIGHESTFEISSTIVLPDDPVLSCRRCSSPERKYNAFSIRRRSWHSFVPALSSTRVRAPSAHSAFEQLSQNERGSATVLFPGTLPGLPVYTVKVHAKFPDHDPAIRGVICLHDARTGTLLAILDSTYITAIRTGIAGALAAHALARADASTVAVIGCGVQGSFQLRALAGLRRLRHVIAFDIRPERAAAFARDIGEELSLPIEPVDELRSAIAAADIVLAATLSTTPLILPGMLRRGTHVTTLGADEPGKAEVSADVIRSSLFVCDDRYLAVDMGALRGAGLDGEVIGAELGEVVGGAHPGRTSDTQITIYGGVGLAFQDAVAACHVYERALAPDAQVHPTIDWLA
jgi:ornithine cyclodeaminase/alanine dehydrogenase-like protein (mu-crystallin family)